VGAILAQLEGFEAPAGAWETEILPNRISEYEPAWLDEQCLAGRFVWTRLSSRRSDPARGAAPVRATPIVLLARRNMRLWSTLAASVDATPPVGERAARGAVSVRARRILFDEIAPGPGSCPRRRRKRSPSWWLLGLVNSDSFAGLRPCWLPADRRRPAMGGRRRRRIALSGWTPRDAGRGSRAATAPPLPITRPARRPWSHLVRTLLRRWGVVFWRLLAREADWLAAVARSADVLRRLEARGEIRGGRFVAAHRRAVRPRPRRFALLRERAASRTRTLRVAVGRRPAEPGWHPHTRCAPAVPER